MIETLRQLIKGQSEKITIQGTLYEKLKKEADRQGVDIEYFINDFLTEALLQKEKEQEELEKKEIQQEKVKSEYQKLDVFLRASLNKQIQIGITNELAGYETEQDIYTLTDYRLNHPSRYLLLDMTRNGEKRPIRLDNIKDIAFLNLPNDRLKVWVYMDNQVWRFILNYDREGLLNQK